jgi:lipopolysaccharide transport system ATP-binding protein
MKPVDVVNIGKMYRVGASDNWALRNITFSVEPGEIVGIVGKNGSGKSTLLKMIADVVTPSEGYIDICGKCGSMLELGTGFHPDLTGKENIYLGGAILGMKRKTIDAIYQNIVDFSGVGDFIDVPVKRYSSGMYVRLAFSVSSHIDAEILLVDEVLSVGDYDFKNKCFDKMRSLSQVGKVILFVSHDLDVVESICTRVILIDRGTLVCDGDPHDVIRRYKGEQP